jgi:hypothetical protein
MSQTKVFDTPERALEGLVRDGMTVAVGGFGLIHGLGLSLGQQLHQNSWIAGTDCLLIHPAHPHPMGDARLLQQAAARS